MDGIGSSSIFGINAGISVGFDGGVSQECFGLYSIGFSLDGGSDSSMSFIL